MPLDQSHPVEVEGIYNLWDFDVDAGYNFRNKKTGKKNLRSAILVELGEVPPPSGGALVGRQHRRPSSHHRRFSFVGFTTPAAASPSFRLQLHRGIIRSEAPTSSLPPQPRPLWSRRCQYLKKKIDGDQNTFTLTGRCSVCILRPMKIMYFPKRVDDCLLKSIFTGG